MKRKCSVCSAPMPDNSNYCEYCNTFNESDARDDVLFLENDNSDTRLCPHCEVPMNPLQALKDENVIIDMCPECFGMFFDRGELRYLVELLTKDKEINVNKIDIGDLEKIPLTSRVDYVKCPVCGDTMHRINYEETSGIVFDYCKKHGIYLDSGELKQILEWKKVGRFDFISDNKRKIVQYTNVTKEFDFDEEDDEFKLKPFDPALVGGSIAAIMILIGFFL